MEVYFDNSATTKVYDEVIDVMADSMRKIYGNPSSAHSLGLKAEDKLRENRKVFGEILNCSEGEIIFTSCGSESNNFLLKGFIKPGLHLITTKIEHPSVTVVCDYLEKQGVEVTFLDVNKLGQIDLEQLSLSIKKETAIVSIMHANNEFGAIQNLEAIGKLIKEKSNRAKFHVDAVQSFCKLKIDLQKCKIDLLSASGHKIHGPRGVGIAYIKKDLHPEPLIHGGGQERNFRSGTENLAAISGFATAAKKMHENIVVNYEKVDLVKRYFVKKLNVIDNILINSPISEDFLPHVLSVSFKGVRGEVLIHALEDKDIFVSTGSACSSKKLSYSPILTFIGLNKKDAEGTIRFSFNEINTKEEVDYVIDNLINSLKFLRRLNK
ncbi:MAG: cysteine desulfurase [Clostridiaceae bacterium]|nr:cysteine desulfurase [Clostridiaceae bacterium]